MNKKIVAVAVAGLFAAPAVALAQSSVTISGVFKMGFENSKINNYTRSGKDSQYGVVDDSSRIIFNVREDLGGGLSAIGQLDMRFKPDDQQSGGTALAGTTTGAVSSGIAAGNSHVGLESKSWGRIFFGRQDLHYFNTSSFQAQKNSLRSDPISILAFTGYGSGKGTTVASTAIAGATRTQNVVHYTTPNWGGFTAIVAYSSNPTATDADITSTQRRGNAWNLNPNYAAANWQVGYSFWKAKNDAGNSAANASATAGNDQRSDRVYANYVFGFGLNVGLAYDHSKLENTINNNTVSKRTAWSIPLQYQFMGKHSITGHYTWAKDDQANGITGGNNNTGAKMWAIGYAYDLSKRTSVALTYAKINNDSNGGYNFFTGTSLGVSAGIRAGEDPRMFGTTLRHAF